MLTLQNAANGALLRYSAGLSRRKGVQVPECAGTGLPSTDSQTTESVLNPGALLRRQSQAKSEKQYRQV